MARLQGANESVSGKHVDFCFRGDPEGPASASEASASRMENRLSPDLPVLPPPVFVSRNFKFSPTLLTRDCLFSDFILRGAFLPLLSSTCEEPR